MLKNFDFQHDKLDIHEICTQLVIWHKNTVIIPTDIWERKSVQWDSKLKSSVRDDLFTFQFNSSTST